jgi:hypothetical protein
VDYALSTSDDGKAAADATLLVTPLHLEGGSNAAPHTSKVELSYDDGTPQRQGQRQGEPGAARAGPGAVPHAARPGR